MVAVIDSVVAGGFAGIAAVGLGLGTVGALVLGALVFLVSLAGFVTWAHRSIASYREELDVLFPDATARGRLSSTESR